MHNISRITYCRNIALVTLRNVPCESGIMAEILTRIAENGINVDMISQTAPLGETISVAFTIAQPSMGRLMPVINSLRPQYPELNLEFSAGMTKLNFYDADMVSTPGVAADVFRILSEGGIRVTLVTTSTVDISVLIPEHAEDQALSLFRNACGAEPAETAFV